jgi:hypothetical protein
LSVHWRKVLVESPLRSTLPVARRGPLVGWGSLAGGTPRRQDNVDLSDENGDFLS